MAGILYIGMICGTFIGGSAGDRYGRRKPLLVISGLLLITGLLSAVMPEFYSFVFMRALVGMCMGAATPIATASLLEANTPKSRGAIVVAVEMLFVLGCIFIIGVAMGLMPDLEPDH